MTTLIYEFVFVLILLGGDRLAPIRRIDIACVLMALIAGQIFFWGLGKIIDRIFESRRIHE